MIRTTLLLDEKADRERELRASRTLPFTGAGWFEFTKATIPVVECTSRKHPRAADLFKACGMQFISGRVISPDIADPRDFRSQMTLTVEMKRDLSVEIEGNEAAGGYRFWAAIDTKEATYQLHAAIEIGQLLLHDRHTNMYIGCSVDADLIKLAILTSMLLDGIGI